MFTMKIVTHDQCRAEYFKKQREKAQRSLDWAIKHGRDEYVIEEKAEILNFYEWAYQMASATVRQKVKTDVIVKCQRCGHFTNRWTTDDGIEHGVCEFCTIDKTADGFCDLGEVSSDG